MQNIKYGMKKKNVDCEALEAGMREAFPQITWVSARVSGTRLVIQIKENKIIQDKTAVEEEACDWYQMCQEPLLILWCAREYLR